MRDMMQCRVNFLDDTHFVWELERNAVGQVLFSKVCEHLDLLERDYYGLVMWDSPSTRVWLDCAKEIQKQIKSPETEFFFSIKFYPPDPSILAEDITRYLLCLQLKKDILIGRLPCPSDILPLLGSYTVQSTLGDYDPNLHKNNYVSEIVLAPNQSEELEERVMELHSTYRFMSPAQADMLFLENAMGLPMYGVDLHPAKDVSGADVMLGVCSEGLMVYEDEIKTNVFPWPRILKISYKRSTFLLKMRPSEQDESEGDVCFRLATYRACKQLWKCSVEHHSFFRNRLQDTKAKQLLTLGSRFRHHGLTQSQCLEASGNITRAPPRFTRYIKRKANEEILDILTQPVRAEFDDWFLVYGPDKWQISKSDDGMLESQKLQEWKHHADDWCVLLDSSQFSISGVQQPLQTKELREDVEVVEGSDERLTDELVIKQSYKVQVVQEGSDVIEKEHQEVMKPLKETLREEVLEVNGERIQRVVITKQWKQEVSSSNSLVESQIDVEKNIERMEMVEMVTEERKFGSGDIFERLEIMEQRLVEVEAIERKLVEVEELRVGLQEMESLEQRLQQVEKEELQHMETDDWYILLDCRPLMLTPTPIGRVQEKLTEIVYIPKLMKKDDDWYILLDVVPQTIEISHHLSDVSSPISEEYEAEEEKRVVEIQIQQELVPPEKPQTQTTEDVIPSRVETEEVQKEQKEPVTRDYGRPQPVVLEQRAAQPQTDEDDDWFAVFDDSPKRSVPSVELHEETREDMIWSGVKTEQIKQQEQVAEDYGRPLILEQRAAQPQRDVEDDWFIIFDVSPKESVLSSPPLRGTTVGLYEETREEKVQSRVRTEEKVIEVMTVSTKEQITVSEKKVVEVMTVSTKEQITVPVKKRTSIVQTPEFPVVPREVYDDWFQLFDKVPYEHKSFPSVSVTPETRVVSVAPLEAEEKRAVGRRKEDVQIKQQEQVTVNYRRPELLAESERDIDDDWFIIFDVSPIESVPSPPQLRGTTVGLYEETREEKVQSRVRTEEKVIEVMIVSTKEKITVPEKKVVEVMTVNTKEQITVPEKKRTSIVQTPEFPVVPREVYDDWFQLFDKVPYEHKSFPSETRVVSVAPLEAEEKRAVGRRKEDVQIKQQEQVTVNYRRPELLAESERDIDDDWFIIFDVSPIESVPSPPQLRGTTVGLYEQTREEKVQSRVRTEEKVIEVMIVSTKEKITVPEKKVVEVMTVNTKEQITVPEKKRTSIVQTPEFPVVPREVYDDWFQLFDKVPYEHKSFPSDVRSTDFEVWEITKGQRVQRVVGEQTREKRLITEEKRVVIDEHRKRADVVPQMIPTRLQEVDDDWFELLDTTPSEKRSVPSVVTVATVERRIKEQKDRERQQEMRVREEEKRRLREQEKRKQELEARKAQPSITLATEVQPQIEAEDDWFILFDVSPEETVVAVDLKVDRSAEEKKRRSEEERKKQIRVEERPKRPSIPEKRPVQLQTALEDDWFTLIGASPKDYVPTLPHTPVISPVAPPKPRPQIPADQPLTSTPAAQPASITKTRQEKTKDILSITLESEAETQSVRSQIWKKKIEGESIYVRHSILMLEDLDVSQELILKHHASITELKRVFMEVKEDFGPTEWDRRLSSYSPSGKAQLPHFNGEILVRMGLIEDDVLLHQQETIYV